MLETILSAPVLFFNRNPIEDHLEGEVGFKTYGNYFTAGADWSVIIFLILVNIAA
ncbi:hypothetical protein Celaphus_00016747, partial [Cervus elaphus hippelaphus]